MMRLFSFDDPEHRGANELLPWFVNGSLSGLERARVERHVGECVACSQEADSLRVLQALVVHDDDADRHASQALARVKARLQNPGPRPRATLVLQSIGSHWRETNPWMRFALVAQLVLVAALIGALLHQP